MSRISPGWCPQIVHPPLFDQSFPYAYFDRKRISKHNTGGQHGSFAWSQQYSTACGVCKFYEYHVLHPPRRLCNFKRNVCWILTDLVSVTRSLALSIAMVSQALSGCMLGNYLADYFLQRHVSPTLVLDAVTREMSQPITLSA